MVRNRVRKTNIGLHTEENMKAAIDLVLDGKKIREASKLTNIPYTTLYRYYIKTIKNEGKPRLTPNYAVHRIFTDDEEKTLVDFIIKCSQMFYGLTSLDVRHLAYQMAQRNNIKVPQKWQNTELAGIDWLYHFRKRHTVLSLRTPEGCSLSRATSFNRHNVNIFFDNLKDVMSRKPAFGNGTRIFNLDETNTMTVQKSSKVFAVRGQKQVSKVTSAEKGTLVTTCYIVNALGQALPPVMIFPRVHFKQHMTAGAPTGTLGLATPSGWMNCELFVKTMQHYIDHTQSSIENPSLLIMDNYEAHISLEAINLAKENGVTILTVPPHSTGKLQPLDVAIFKPFKVAYNAAVDSWLMRNSGKTFSIYEVSQCVREAHMKAMTPANICSSFQCTGIFPYNREIFTDIDFAPSEVTDRNNLQIELTDNIVTRSPSPSIMIDLDLSHNSPIPDTEVISPPTDESTSTKNQHNIVSPFEFRGIPKAGPLKNPRKPRRKGRSIIATDTPNKIEIEKRREDQKKKKERKMAAKAKKRKVLQSESSDEENDRISIYSEEEGEYENVEDEEVTIDPDNFRPLDSYPKEGSFVLVEFIAKNKKVFYIGKVIIEANENQELEVNFLRKSQKIANGFILPNVPDITKVSIDDIKVILPTPAFTGTKRQQGVYKFDQNFSRIDVR